MLLSPSNMSSDSRDTLQSSSSSAFLQRIPNYIHSNSKNVSKGDSSINPTRVLHSLSKTAPFPKFEITEYASTFTKSDDVRSFQLPSGSTSDKELGIVILGRYILKDLLSTDGVTRVVYKFVVETLVTPHPPLPTGHSTFAVLARILLLKLVLCRFSSCFANLACIFLFFG